MHRPTLRPRIVYFIGDCHAAVYNQLLFRDAASGEYLLGLSSWSGNVSCDNIISDDGAISPNIYHSLAVLGLLEEHRGSWRVCAEDAQPRPPTIVVSCGESDVSAIVEGLGSQVNVAWPYEAEAAAFGLEREEAAGRLLPFALFESVIRAKVARLIAFLRELRALFPTLAVTSIVPQPGGGACVRSELHLKVTLLFHRLLRAGCAQERVHFLDTWPHLARDGVLRPEFALDERHANVHAAPAAVAALRAAESGESAIVVVTKLRAVHFIGERHPTMVNGHVSLDDAGGGIVTRRAIVPQTAMCTLDPEPNRFLRRLIRALEASEIVKIDQGGGRFAYPAQCTLDVRGNPVPAPHALQPDLVFFVGGAELASRAGRRLLLEGLRQLGEAWIYLRDIGFARVSVAAPTATLATLRASEERLREFNSDLAVVAGISGVRVLAAGEVDEPSTLLRALRSAGSLEGPEDAPRVRSHEASADATLD